MQHGGGTITCRNLNAVTSRLLCANAAHKPDPPVRIDYVWSDGSPTTVQLINRNVTRGLSISDHLGVEVRTAWSPPHTWSDALTNVVRTANMCR